MGKKKSQFVELQLKPILFMYGITSSKAQDDFLKHYAKAIQDNVCDQIAGYARQVMVDCYNLALHEEFGFGAERLRRLESIVDQLQVDIDITSMDETLDNLRNGNVEEDGTTDVPTLKNRIDHRLRDVFGDSVKPYDVRYREAQDKEKAHGWSRAKEIVGELGYTV